MNTREKLTIKHLYIDPKGRISLLARYKLFPRSIITPEIFAQLIELNIVHRAISLLHPDQLMQVKSKLSWNITSHSPYKIDNISISDDNPYFSYWEKKQFTQDPFTEDMPDDELIKGALNYRGCFDYPSEMASKRFTRTELRQMNIRFVDPTSFTFSDEETERSLRDLIGELVMI